MLEYNTYGIEANNQSLEILDKIKESIKKGKEISIFYRYNQNWKDKIQHKNDISSLLSTLIEANNNFFDNKVITILDANIIDIENDDFMQNIKNLAKQGRFSLYFNNDKDANLNQATNLVEKIFGNEVNATKTMISVGTTFLENSFSKLFNKNIATRSFSEGYEIGYEEIFKEEGKPGHVPPEDILPVLSELFYKKEMTEEMTLKQFQEKYSCFYCNQEKECKLSIKEILSDTNLSPELQVSKLKNLLMQDNPFNSKINSILCDTGGDDSSKIYDLDWFLKQNKKFTEQFKLKINSILLDNTILDEEKVVAIKNFLLGCLVSYIEKNIDKFYDKPIDMNTIDINIKEQIIYRILLLLSNNGTCEEIKSHIKDIVITSEDSTNDDKKYKIAANANGDMKRKYLNAYTYGVYDNKESNLIKLNIENKTIPEIANELLNSTTYKNILNLDSISCDSFDIYVDLRILLDHQSEIAKKTRARINVSNKSIKVIKSKKTNLNNIQNTVSTELFKSIEPDKVRALLNAA